MGAALPRVRKLLVAHHRALSHYVSREFASTLSLLLTDYGWRLFETGDLPEDRGEMDAIMHRRYGGWPDAVLFWESYGDLLRFAGPFLQGESRIYVATDDLHRVSDAMDLALRVASGVLSTYAPRLETFVPGLMPSRVHWVPHAAGPDFWLPFNEAPRRVVFVSGAMHDVYPLRLAMRDLALRRPELAYLHEHPGYHCDYDYTDDDRIGRGYAEAMRSCVAGFTDALTYHYLVAKHFEIPATGALLIADRAVAGQLARLGFVDGEHYVSTTAEELESTVERVVDVRNAPEIDAIRRRGQALTDARHTTAHRARQIDGICV
jgi:hypothetical protein